MRRLSRSVRITTLRENLDFTYQHVAPSQEAIVIQRYCRRDVVMVSLREWRRLKGIEAAIRAKMSVGQRGDLAALYAELEGYAARIAFVLHTIRGVSCEADMLHLMSKGILRRELNRLLNDQARREGGRSFSTSQSMSDGDTTD